MHEYQVIAMADKEEYSVAVSVSRLKKFNSREEAEQFTRKLKQYVQKELADDNYDITTQNPIKVPESE